MRILFETVAALALLWMFVNTGLHYASLPDQVPTHYNAAGEPNRMGPKAMVWLLPVVAAWTYLLMTFVSRLRTKLNLPFPVDQTTPAVRAEMQRMMAALKMVIVAGMAYLNVRIVAAPSQGFGFAFLPALIATPILVLAIFLTRLRRYRL